MSGLASESTLLDVAARGIVHEITISRADVDLTLDPADNYPIGPCRAFWVVAGSGNLRYRDGERGKVRTLSNLSAGSGGRICASAIVDDDGNTFSGILRVLW